MQHSRWIDASRRVTADYIHVDDLADRWVVNAKDPRQRRA
jgi:hypothetical protein